MESEVKGNDNILWNVFIVLDLELCSMYVCYCTVCFVVVSLLFSLCLLLFAMF
jgi:hypothetical protein